MHRFFYYIKYYTVTNANSIYSVLHALNNVDLRYSRENRYKSAMWFSIRGSSIPYFGTQGSPFMNFSSQQVITIFLN